MGLSLRLKSTLSLKGSRDNRTFLRSPQVLEVATGFTICKQLSKLLRRLFRAIPELQLDREMGELNHTRSTLLSLPYTRFLSLDTTATRVGHQAYMVFVSPGFLVSFVLLRLAFLRIRYIELAGISMPSSQASLSHTLL